MKTLQDWIALISTWINQLEELKSFLQGLSPKKDYLPALSKYVVILDAGHGSLNPEGVYTTNGKYFIHPTGTFHKGSTFFEGMFNRIIITNYLIPMLKEARIEYEVLYHDYLDTPLEERTRRANLIGKKKKSFGISAHSNAANSKARGFSCFTSPGRTKSDLIADKLLEEVKGISKEYGFTMRYDFSDGDGDWEARFWMLVKTDMPFILPECLFFDNLEDAKILMNVNFQKAYAKCLFNTIVYVMNNVEL